MTNNRDQQDYYQAIARHLFQLRGAPFMISPQESEAIRTWEELRIPLRIILEGMEAAFEYCLPGMKKKLKLNHCHKFVMQRFKQHRERRIGNRRTETPSSAQKEKKNAVLREVNNFLKTLPAEAGFLAAVFSQAALYLEKSPINEKIMEKWDQKTDQLIWKNIPLSRKRKLKKEIKKEWGLSESEELTRLVRLKAVKSFREKFRVPYLSPYYY